MSKELQDLLAKAVEHVKHMTPQERDAMWLAQRNSWVRGEMGMDETMVPIPSLPAEGAIEELPDPELRHAMDMICRRFLNIELTISQNREMAKAVENWFRNKGFSRSKALERMADEYEAALKFKDSTNRALQEHMGKTRTPGTVEVCPRFLNNSPCGYDIPGQGLTNCKQANCPIRAKGEQVL